MDKRYLQYLFDEVIPLMMNNLTHVYEDASSKIIRRGYVSDLQEFDKRIEELKNMPDRAYGISSLFERLAWVLEEHMAYTQKFSDGSIVTDRTILTRGFVDIVHILVWHGAKPWLVIDPHNNKCNLINHPLKMELGLELGISPVEKVYVSGCSSETSDYSECNLAGIIAQDSKERLYYTPSRSYDAINVILERCDYLGLDRSKCLPKCYPTDLRIIERVVPKLESMIANLDYTYEDEQHTVIREGYLKELYELDRYLNNVQMAAHEGGSYQFVSALLSRVHWSGDSYSERVKGGTVEQTDFTKLTKSFVDFTLVMHAHGADPWMLMGMRDWWGYSNCAAIYNPLKLQFGLELGMSPAEAVPVYECQNNSVLLLSCNLAGIVVQDSEALEGYTPERQQINMESILERCDYLGIEEALCLPRCEPVGSQYSAEEF